MPPSPRPLKRSLETTTNRHSCNTNFHRQVQMSQLNGELSVSVGSAYGPGEKDKCIIDKKKNGPTHDESMTFHCWRSLTHLPSCIPPTAPYLQPPSRPPRSMPTSSSSPSSSSPPPHDLLSVSPALGLTHLILKHWPLPTLPRSLDWCPRCFIPPQTPP